ncbi:hypothetical protein AGMMS49928_18540 [Spirochaetia bacterium]|nr:hypothetical protein AGMMS49928_18540 [Spirochaetia bacterium]
MSSDICPSLFFIVPEKNTKPYNKNDIFMPDRFKILQAEKLTHVKEIISNAGTDQPLQIRLLCCYRMKDLPESYCTARHIDDPKKQVCDDEFGIKTSFIHFHIRPTKLSNVEYLLAFIESADLYGSIEEIVQELFSTMIWLGISAPQVYLNIFTFGEPVYKTRNVSFLDACIHSTKDKITTIHTNNIECDVTHISKNFENCLRIFLKNKNLQFNPS